MSTKFGSYSGKALLELELKKREWLVENLIRENDSVILVGTEKSGKSVFIKQFICAITSGEPFIDKYNVPKQLKVTYIQCEGELSDTQDRFKRMIKTQSIDTDNFHYMFMPPMELEKRHYAMEQRDTIQKYWKEHSDSKPDIVIIDPTYFAFVGSLSDDAIVRQFIGNIRIIKDSLNCAIVLVHHTHKPRWNKDGASIEEGDEAIFGSKFLKAWADHTFLFTYDKAKNIRVLTCATQRSGDILQDCTLKLIEPEPLYFEEVDPKRVSVDLRIMELLMKPENTNGLEWTKIMSELNISKTCLYNSLKRPLGAGIIVKEGKRPALYKYNKKGVENEQVQVV